MEKTGCSRSRCRKALVPFGMLDVHEMIDEDFHVHPHHHFRYPDFFDVDISEPGNHPLWERTLPS
jgi:hypothetical protein